MSMFFFRLSPVMASAALAINVAQEQPLASAQVFGVHGRHGERFEPRPLVPNCGIDEIGHTGDLGALLAREVVHHHEDVDVAFLVRRPPRMRAVQNDVPQARAKTSLERAPEPLDGRHDDGVHARLHTNKDITEGRDGYAGPPLMLRCRRGNAAMSKAITLSNLPEHLARFAEAQVTAGRFASVCVRRQLARAEGAEARLVGFASCPGAEEAHEPDAPREKRQKTLSVRRQSVAKIGWKGGPEQ